MRSAGVLLILFAYSALAANRPPVIEGAPPLAHVGEPFVYQLSASDADGDAVSFRVGSRPSWLSLDIYSGKLSGTPTAEDVGAFTITVAANDGRGGVSSQSMRILVRAANRMAASATRSASSAATGKAHKTAAAAVKSARSAEATGKVVLTWKAPTRNTDGSAAAIRGYRILYGGSEWALTESIDVPASEQRYVVERLAPGTYYFSVQAIGSRGESGLSEIVKKTVQ